MRDLQRFSFILAAVILFLSCKMQDGQNTSAFKKIAPYSCRSKQKNVFLFYAGDSIGFRYKVLGKIEASGKADLDDQAILDRLKYTAYQNCANAIIGIRTETREKNYGSEFRTGSKTYTSRTYIGTAVRIEPDSVYKNNSLGNHQDLSFIRNTINHNHDREKKALTTGGVAVLVSALFLGIYVLTAYR